MSDLPVFIENQQIVTNGDMSANILSTSQNISEFSNYAVHCSWSGSTPVGSLDVLGSNDGIIFTSVGTLAVSGNTGLDLFNVFGAAYKYMQVSYTFTSGTGTLNVYLSAKRS